MNVADVAPATTVTVAGTAALVTFELKDTANPPVGAGPLIVTDPVTEVPPMTVVGLREKPLMTGGVIVRVAETVVPPSEADIEAVVVLATAVVVTTNVTLVAPLGTVAVAGTTALELPELRFTMMPPLGAGPLKVNVPVDEDPPMTDAGATVRLAGTGGVIVSVAFAVTPPSVAEIVAFVANETAEVLMLKEAVVCPANTLTWAGGTALKLLEPKTTTIPPFGAGPFNVTVPFEDVPPVTDAGDSDSDDGVGGVMVILAVRGTRASVAVS